MHLGNWHVDSANTKIKLMANISKKEEKNFFDFMLVIWFAKSIFSRSVPRWGGLGGLEPPAPPETFLKY